MTCNASSKCDLKKSYVARQSSNAFEKKCFIRIVDAKVMFLEAPKKTWIQINLDLGKSTIISQNLWKSRSRSKISRSP